MIKVKKYFLLIAFFVITFSTISSGQNIILTQSNDSGIYKNGEKIQVKAYLRDMESDSLSIKIIKNFTDEIINKKIEYSGSEVLLFTKAYNEPTSLIFRVHTEGKFASIGLIVDPENIAPGTPRPEDIDSYWENEKQKLQALEMKIKSVPVSNIKTGYYCADIEINCTGPKPARGYFAKPEAAKKKSLPIVLTVHAAGVSGSWCLSKPENAMRYAQMGKGVLCFDLNAHGMLNGQPKEYYIDLQKGELDNYFYNGVESRNDFYFKGMYLRLIRTLDFLVSQPEWDGKRILVVGESQGGGQALVAAGLYKQVTAVVATVPAMCDWGGTFVGRKGGWPDPLNTQYDREKMLATLPYFDAAHLLTNSKATLVTEIGLIDMTCPSMSIYAAINQAKGKKITLGVPYRAHHMSQKIYKKTWEETIYKSKMDFIENYLK